MKSVKERLKNLGGEGEKVKKPKYVKKGGNGGARRGSGRKNSDEKAEKRGIAVLAEGHYAGSVTVKITDPKTGREKTINKPRLLILLERLFKAGAEGDIDAANKWLNRALGMPKQTLSGDEEKPILLKIDF